MNTQRMIRWSAPCSALTVCIAMTGCSDVSEQTAPVIGSSQSAIEVIVDPPSGVNCFNLNLRNQNGVETSEQLPLEPLMRFRNIAVGVYEVTAQAYQAADCQVVPLNSPWGTREPTIVIVERGQATEVTLELFRTGRILVTPQFVETAEVVAQQQGPVGTISAVGNRIAWTVEAIDGPGAVVSFIDNRSPDDTPIVVATDQQAPGDINIEPISGDIYWTNRSSGALDGNGNPVFDGSIWRHRIMPPISEPVAVNEGHPFEIAAFGDAVYWANFDSSEIRLFVPSTSTVSTFVGGQLGANSIAFLPMPPILVWTNIGDGAVRFANVPDPTPIDIFVPPPMDPRLPVSVASDGTFAYWTDFDNAVGGSRILRAPLTGGPPEVLFPPAGEDPLSLSFNAEVFGDFVYVNSIDGVSRIAKDGSGQLEVIQTGQTGGLALTTFNGNPFIYWTDKNFGGLVWRARLE